MYWTGRARAGTTVRQIAINWQLRTTLESVIIGGRIEGQLRQKLGAVDWR